jgi:P27 family predicted phage terminase small subunit
MKPGQKPKPTTAQIAAGDPRKKGVHKLERQLAAEPKAPRGLPACPAYLEGRAREAWAFWSNELALMDLDRRPDGPMLEGVCIAYDAAIACYETIKTQGRFIAKKALDPATNKLVVVDVKPHPAVRQGNQALALMKAFCSEFGLSPVSRTRLAIDKQDEAGEDLLELLGRPRAKRTLPPSVVVQ